MVLSDLNEGEYSFLRLAENLPGIVYRVLIEDDNRMIFFNDMVQNMTGYRPEDLKQGKVCSIDPIIVPEDKSNVINIVKDAIDNNVPFEVEYRINNKSGELRWFFERGRPIRGDNGNPPYIEGVIFDITDQKEVEKKLKTSEEQYRILSTELETILDHYPGLAFYKDTNNNFIRINQNVVDYYNSDSAGVKVNLTKKDIEGKNLSDLLPEDIAQAYWDDDLEVINSGTPKLNIEESFKTEHGIKWLNSNKIPYFDENGEIRGIIGFSIDITERKVAEKKLEESQGIFEQLNKVFLKFKEDPIFNLQLLINTAGLLLNADCALFNMLKRVNGKEVLESLVTYNEPPNFTRESDPKGHICTDIIKDNPDNVVILRNLDKTDYIKTDENVRKYDLKQYVSYVVRFNNKPTATFCVVYTENREMSKSDINILQILSKSASTELARWNSRIDLQKSEKKFKLLYENAPLGYLSLDLKGNILEVNKACINFFGYSKEEVIGNWFGDFIDSEYLEVFTANFHKFKETGEICEEEMGVVKKDGSHAIVLFDGNISYDENGNFKQIHCIFQDITEQKNAEQQIIQEREKAKLYLNLVEVILVALDVDGKITLINKKGHELLGYEEGELIGKDWFEVCLPPHDRKRVYEYFKKLMAGELEVVKSYENSVWTKNGEEKLIAWSTFLFRDEHGNVTRLLSSGEDITKRKKAEEKLQLERDNFLNILNSMEDGVYIVDQNYDIEFVNPSFIKEFGQFEGMKCFKYFEDRSDICPRCKKKEVFQGKTVREEWFSFKNQKTYDVIDTPLENPDGSISKLGIFRDETDKKQAEVKLKESEEKFRKQNEFLNNILESLTHPFYVINVKDYRVALANSTASSEGLELGHYCYSLTHNNNKPCEAPCKCPLDEVKKTKRACVVEHTHSDSKGNEKIYEIYGYPILDESGNVVQMIEYTLNITDRKKAENNLRKIAHQWRTTFDAMSESVFLLDIEQNILQCNKATLDLLGKENYDEIIGHSCCEIIHGTNKPVEWCPMIRMIESSQKQASIAQLGDKWCEISSDPVINDEGILIGAVHIITDITERRKTEQKLIESEEKFRTIAERSLMGILIVQDNQVKYVNEALVNMLEYSQNEKISWEIDDLIKLIHPEDLQFLNEYRESLRSGSTSIKPFYSYRVFTKSGKIKWIDQFSKEIRYQGKSAELVTILDITETKEAEQELIKLNNLKSELLRRTSHELRTPLVSIKGFSDLLLELHRDKLDDYVIKTINQIRGGCSRLESIVNDILKTAELESGTVQLEKSKGDLSLLIKLCVSELEGLSELRNHTINLDIPDKLICTFEKEQIYNVITNILSNAIKFTPPSGKIEVKSEINNGFIIISIKDNGIGFTEEERSLIFKQFGKIERYGQGYDVISEGSGLGLYISKKIVELHGGEIWIESEGRDKGSTFYFSLPII